MALYTSTLGKSSDSSGIVTYVPSGPNKITIRGQTSNPVDREYTFPIPDNIGPGPTLVRVTKLSNDSTPQNRTDISFKNYTEIIEDKLTYPNSAYFYITADAEQFSGKIPSRAYLLKLLKIKVPTNYDPVTRVYTGLWDGTFKVAWTNNPAWVFYDMATNSRYGLGEFMSDAQVDKWSLYTIAKYCDELVSDGMGGQEPRFSCNLYLQSREDAYTVMQNLASVFRGMTYWATSQLITIQDAPKTPVAVYSQSNVIDGKFTYEGSSAKARHSVALVTWNDPEDLYKSKVEYVEDTESLNTYGLRQLEVVATGCTSRGQAHRLGRWMLFSEKLETQVINFRAGLDNAGILPGDLIKVFDSARSGVRYSGRMPSLSASEITLDKAVELTAGVEYTISIPIPKGREVTLPDGNIKTSTVAEIYEVTYTPVSSGFVSTLPIIPNFTTLPLVNGLWSISEPNLVAQTFRVLGVAQESANQISISGLEHNNSKFDFVENNLDFVLDSVSIDRLSPGSVDSVEYDEILLFGASGDIQTNVLVSWAVVENAHKFRVEYRTEETIDGELVDSVWNIIEETTTARYAEIPDIPPGATVFVRVYPINNLGAVGDDYEDTLGHLVIGKSAPPEDVTGFSISLQTFDTLFTWDAVSDLDLAYYEIREGTDWSIGSVIATNITNTFYTRPRSLSGTYDYMIKAVDTSGNESDIETTYQIVVPDPSTVTGFSATRNLTNIDFVWNVVGGFNIYGYEIRKGNDWATGTPIVSDLASDSFTRAINPVVNTTENFFISAIDNVGNYSSTAATVSVITQPPADVTGFINLIDTYTVALRWNPTADVNVEYYEIREGTIWSSGVLIDTNISGNQLVLNKTVSGSYDYMIKAVDNLGNYSANAVSTVVTVPYPDDVSGFVATLRETDVLLTWSPVANLNLSGYSVRYGASWATGSSISENFAGTSISVPRDSTLGTIYFTIKSLDSAGNYSENETVTSYLVEAPAEPSNLSITRNSTDLLLSWDSVINTTYEVRRGNNWESGVVLVSNHASSTFIVDESSAGNYTYHVKSTDYVGNQSTNSSIVSISLVQPGKVQDFVVAQSGDRTEFDWSQNPQSDFVVEYEIREGSEWNSSILITNTSSTNFTLRSAFDTTTVSYLIKAIAAPGIYSKDAATFVNTAYVASPTVGNLVYSKVGDTAWADNRINFDIFETNKLKQTNNSGNTAEYIFESNLGSEYLARNSLNLTTGIVLADTDTWANSNFDWTSVNAERTWSVSGANSNAVSFVPQICRDIGLKAGQVEGFGLNSSINGYNGTTPVLSSGVTYDFARFNKGLVLDNGAANTTVSWSISPTASNLSANFWIKVVDLYDLVYLRLYNTSTLKHLRVEYNNTAKTIDLIDSDNNTLSVSITLAVDDYILIGIDQTSTDRSLFVNRLHSGMTLTDTNTFTPIDTFDELRLY